MIYMRVRNEVESFTDLIYDIHGPIQAATVDVDMVTEMVISDVLADAGKTEEDLKAMDEDERIALFDQDLYGYIDLALPTGCYSVSTYCGWQAVLRPGMTDVYCPHGSAVDVIHDADDSALRAWVAESGSDYTRHHCGYVCR